MSFSTFPFSSYDLIRPLLFCCPPECAHELTMRMLSMTQHTVLARLYKKQRINDPVTIAGITFPNRIGLAAGLDKNGTCIDGLGHMGFGFIEAGTVTPKAQPGNPKPRMFRLVEANALVNSCGFNNEGVEYFIKHINQSQYRSTGGILGLNIGKNKDTPNERANDDYLAGLTAVYPYADYIAINISSPNTQNLRDLQSEEAFDALLGALMQKRSMLADEQGRLVPLFVKIAPDLDEAQIGLIAEALLKHGIDGVIATNTTISRQLVSHLPHSERPGGLSGAPLRNKSNEVIRLLRKNLGADYPIMGVGGVMSGHDAIEKIEAGADLVQIYTGLIYKGPDLVSEAAQAVAAHTQQHSAQPS